MAVRNLSSGTSLLVFRLVVDADTTCSRVGYALHAQGSVPETLASRQAGSRLRTVAFPISYWDSHADAVIPAIQKHLTAQSNRHQWAETLR
jgi:hypothetical protein